MFSNPCYMPDAARPDPRMLGTRADRMKWPGCLFDRHGHGLCHLASLEIRIQLANQKGWEGTGRRTPHTSRGGQIYGCDGAGEVVPCGGRK